MSTSKIAAVLLTTSLTVLPLAGAHAATGYVPAPPPAQGNFFSQAAANANAAIQWQSAINARAHR